MQEEVQNLCDARYGGQWSAIADRAKALQGNHCACCGKPFPAAFLQVHHTRYSDELGMLGDRAIPGADVFAVCGTKQTAGTCHHRLHQPDAWLVDPINPAVGNRNTPEVVKKLKSNFQALAWKSQKPQAIEAPRVSEDQMPSDRFSRRLQGLQGEWERLELEPLPKADWQKQLLKSAPEAGVWGLIISLILLLL